MDPQSILRDYKSLRAKGTALNNVLAEMLSGPEIDAAAKELGMLRGKTINLETHDEICVLMDHAIHEMRRDGLNAVDRLLLENRPPEGSDELRLLRSLQKAHYTIFDMETPILGLGVRGFIGPEKTPILLIDIGFSQTAVPGMAMATRLHSPGDGWWMTTGAALPLNDEAMDRIIDGIEQYKRRHGVEPPAHERTTIMVRACVSSGASRQIVYGKPGQRLEYSAPSESVATSDRIGRNEPCPCGSGKKYKKCCGA